MKELDVYTTGGGLDHYGVGAWDTYAQQESGSLTVRRLDGTGVLYAPGSWRKAVTTLALHGESVQPEAQPAGGASHA